MIRSFAFIAAVYAVALAAAAYAATFSADLHAQLAIGTTVATIVVFAGSRAVNNSSVYDAYWSVFPLAAVLWFALPNLTERGALVVGVTSVWALRLTFNWARGWGGLTHEDWRYVDLRRKTGALYWPVSLVGLHGFPTLLTFLGTLPAIEAVGVPGLGFLDAPAAYVSLAGIAIETAADEQLLRFRRTHPDGACDTGLWRFSRHPNYFGEILFWVGLWLLGVSAGAPAWMAVGPGAMLALFWFVSIPMAEQRALAKRPDFARRIATTSRLVPWFPFTARR